MKKHPWKIIAVIAVVLLGASIAYSQYAGQAANEGIELSEHVKGNPDASVTLTEYADLQCPACGQFYPIIKEVVDQYGDDLRFEFKHFPLVQIHSFAVPAAKAAEAAGQQGKFFEMHDKLFENQTAWSQSSNPQPYFEKYAEELELDMDLFKRHMKASVIQDRIESEFNEARQKGLTGTPTFFLNGERMEFDSFEEFIGAIESAIGITPESASTTQTTEDASSVIFGI